MRRLALPALLLLLAASPAVADRLHLDTGRVLEGTVHEDGDVYVVKTASGIEARIPKAKVVRLERAPAPADEYAQRLAALPADDLRAHKRLVAWCEAQGLRREARALRERIIDGWPHDVETRRALDHVLHQGRWMTRADYMRSLGLVDDEAGSWISPEEAEERREEARARALRPQVEAVLRRLATDPPESVQEALGAFDDRAAVPVLGSTLRSENPKARLFAAQELGRRRAERAELHLARAAVEDTKRTVREQALESLGRMHSTTRARSYFVKALDRENPFQVAHAAAAIGRYPSVGAVPRMIYKLRESTGGFGKVSISITTQRAYIQDFELSSGGTGNIVAEVADPVIGTFTEGVTMETKVRSWYRYRLVQALRSVTGKSYGGKASEWDAWWKDAKDDFHVPAR